MKLTTGRPLDWHRTAHGDPYSPPPPRAIPCKDCGKLVTEARGTTRGDVFRCGPCDIEFCDAEVCR